MIKFAAELRIKAGIRNFEGDDQYVIKPLRNYHLAAIFRIFSIFSIFCRWMVGVPCVRACSDSPAYCHLFNTQLRKNHDVRTSS
jgi:hypothetical protein